MNLKQGLRVLKWMDEVTRKNRMLIEFRAQKWYVKSKTQKKRNTLLLRI